MKLFGLIGYPLSHSLSEEYFTQKFRKLGVDHQYKLFPLENINKFRQLIENNPHLAGLNVTLPHKQTIIPLLDDLDEQAREIGAVNTILIDRKDEKIFCSGYNTDAYGFDRSLGNHIQAAHSKALVLGSGGASKAVCYVLKNRGIDYTLVSRKKTGSNTISWLEINKHILNQHKLLINTTPVGMSPAVCECPLLPYAYITVDHLVFDLIYNPEQTTLLERCKNHGARTVNGLEMLHYQAEKAWEIWEGGK